MQHLSSSSDVGAASFSVYHSVPIPVSQPTVDSTTRTAAADVWQLNDGLTLPPFIDDALEIQTRFIDIW